LIKTGLVKNSKTAISTIGLPCFVLLSTVAPDKVDLACISPATGIRALVN
jgi:hypothetical protein